MSHLEKLGSLLDGIISKRCIRIECEFFDVVVKYDEEVDNG
jgi:hypothetical protein